MKLTYLGHSAFMLEINDFKALIDPYISNNPSCPIKEADLNGITHIFVTHGHGDHLGDSIAIAKRCNSTVICNFELGIYLSVQNVNVHSMHIGGKTSFEFGKVKMTPALHGSGIIENDNVICGGNPCGFVIEISGKKLYHAGDTGLTMDMQLLKDEKIDVALIPIGGNYTMDIDDAVRAVDFIAPKAVIPMHYNTFPPIQANPLEFKEKVSSSKVIILKPGDIYNI